MQDIYLAPSADCDGVLETALGSLSVTGGLLRLAPGDWPRHRTVTIPTTSRPIAVQGAHSDVVRMISDPGIIAFQYEHVGASPRPRLSFSGLSFLGAGRALRLVPAHNVDDPTTYFYGIDLADLVFENNRVWSVELRGSMGPRLNRMTARGCENVYFLGDCGEISLADLLDENCGIGMMLSGSGLPNDHMAEGPMISRWCSNGAVYPLVIDNYAFLTTSNLQLTSSRGPSVWSRGRSANLLLDGVFGGLRGVSDAIHIEPTALGDASARAERVIVKGMVYGSEFGIVARHVNELEIAATFCTQANVDIYLDDCRNHRITATMTSDPAGRANLIELANCRGGSFIGCKSRYPMALNGASRTEVGNSLVV